MIILNNKEKEISMSAVIITNDFSVEPSKWNGIIWTGTKNRSDDSVYAYIPFKDGVAVLPTEEELVKIKEQLTKKYKKIIENDLDKKYPDGYELKNINIGTNSMIFDFSVNNETVAGCYIPEIGTYVFE